jgi:hypothetical protein
MATPTPAVPFPASSLSLKAQAVLDAGKPVPQEPKPAAKPKAAKAQTTGGRERLLRQPKPKKSKKLKKPTAKVGAPRKPSFELVVSNSPEWRCRNCKRKIKPGTAFLLDAKTQHAKHTRCPKK